MERSLKERLIGAAVLVAVATILIPEMLSGPSTPTQPNTTLQTPTSQATPNQPVANSPNTVTQTPNATDAVPTARGDESANTDQVDLKSYTIDLRKSDPDAQANEQAPLDLPPVAASRAGQTTPPTSSAAVIADNAAHEAPQATPSIQSSSSKPSAEIATVSSGWAVQLASLGTRASADQMASELKKDGFGAFVMPFESKGKMLYRVRLGPFRDRPSAESVQAKVKQAHSAAAVVPHP